MGNDQVRLLDGSTFVVGDGAGDIGVIDDLDGLFYRDVRHLSRWRLLINGERVRTVATDEVEYDTAIFYAVEPGPAPRENGELTLLRERQLRRGIQERLTITNVGRQRREVTVTIEFAADFADLFEVREGNARRRRIDRQVVEDEVTLCYQRGEYQRKTHICAPGAVLTGESATFTVSVAGGEQWSTTIDIAVTIASRREAYVAGRHPYIGTDLPGWLEAMPKLATDWSPLAACYQRSLVDLAALRFYPDVLPRSSLLAAGLPWFMTLFGRDSLIASYESLPFMPELCRTTLRALATMQADCFDDKRDAEPGKIMHELRHGELVYFGDRPQTPYYGTCDATPLFLVVLDEYERWTGDADTVRHLEGAARAALTWIERYGDLDGDGYLEYRTRNPRHGLTNQSWKDSPNSILYPDGRSAPLPRATCELQGYAYDARIRTARLARQVWQDDTLASRLERDAAALRDTFNRDFWLADQRAYALALDGDKQPVPTIASNMGHLLWSGIVPPERVDAVAGHLLGGQMFSGWGVRTLAAGQIAYNPIGYHVGAVWPHDNAIIAAGLWRYGRRDAASRIVAGIIDAAPTFDYRLPEAFAGEDRDHIGVPLPYPRSNYPQAWASAAPLLFIRVLLGLDPSDGGLTVAPHLPPSVGKLALSAVHLRGGRVDVPK